MTGFATTLTSPNLAPEQPHSGVARDPAQPSPAGLLEACKGAAWWPLAGAGLAMEAVCLIAVGRLPWWQYAGRLPSWSQILGTGWQPFVACLAGIGILAAAYLWGWGLVRRGQAARRVVWVFASLFAATLFWLLPITSDLFGYLVQAHLLTDQGRNPLEDAPLEGPPDPLVTAYAGPYADQSSVYGPAWTVLSAPATLGHFDVAAGLVYLKGLATVAYLGSAWLVERVLRRLRPAEALLGLYLFAWNPLVLLLAVGDGHNDMVMMGLALLAVWLLLRERWGLAFGTLALSAWVKYGTLVLLPLFLIYAWHRLAASPGARRWAVLARALAPAAGVSVAVLVPLWSSEGAGAFVQRFLQPANWAAASPGWPAWAMILGLVLFSLTYVGLLWWLAREGGSFQRLCHGAFMALFLALVLGLARSQPWHLIWPAALASLSNRRWVWPVVGGLSVLLLGAQVWVEWGAPGWPLGS